MRWIFIPALLSASLAFPVFAGLAEGVTAYKSGDYKMAYAEFLPLAEQGDANVQHNLGMMYSTGKGVARDYKEAFKWHRRAAEQGQSKSQYSLGNMYFLGYGISQSNEEALKWFRKAVGQNEHHAKHRLGQMYEKGVGVPKNYVKAYMWFSLAVSGGVRKSIRYRNFLKDLMTPEQIADASKLASEWSSSDPVTAATL